MEQIEGFKLDQVPHWMIIAVATSEPDYEMDRVLIARHYPDYGDYTVIHGGHCSCYDFDEAGWTAVKYNDEELLALLRGWAESGWNSEKLIVQPALAAIGKML